VENDLMVKSLWKTMDTPNKIVPSREKLLAGIKEAGAIAAYHEPILQMEERKKLKGFKKKRDEEPFE
ncbi:hypothetical protein N9I82_02055, partial [Alphaproteobacteria bacterium]|nr:hypothetical protein [Alphaproteobacteria bacterium]